MTDVQSLFRGRKLVIATMHGKEQVIAPVLQEALGVEMILTGSLNTDTFGTFSGEIPRELSPEAAALAKCNLAMQLTGCDLAVASEGSFGRIYPDEWIAKHQRKDPSYLPLPHRHSEGEVIFKMESTPQLGSENSGK